MASKNFINLNEFSADSVSFSEPKKNKNGGKSIFVNYKYSNDCEPKKLRIRINDLKAPFGISGWKDGSGCDPDSKSNDNLSFLLDTDKKHSIFKNMNNKVIEYILENAVLVLGESEDEYTAKDIKRLYVNPVKIPKDKDSDKGYHPHLQTKLYKNGEKYSGITYYEQNSNKIELDVNNQKKLISKGAICNCVIECNGLWVVGGRIGITWKVVQIKVKPGQDSLSDDILNSDSEEECNDEVTTIKNTSDTNNNSILDLDDDIDNLEISEPKPVLKRRTRKAA